MQKVFRALLLILTLSVGAYAGHIPNDVTVTPSPTPITSTTVQEPSDTSSQGSQAAESISAEIALNLLQNLLSLF